MTDIDKETPLYQAAVECMVSEQTSTTAWERMCTWVRDMHGQLDMKAEFAAVEKRIKSEYGITTMPAVWRSNKSVILKSVGAGVSLFDGDKPIPKTALETVLKNKAKSTPLSDWSILISALANTRTAFKKYKHPLSPSDRAALEYALREIDQLLGALPNA